MIKATVNTRRTQDYMYALRKQLGVSLKSIVGHETIAICKKTASFSKPAKAAAVRAGVNFRAVREEGYGEKGYLSMNTGKRGGEATRTFYRISGREKVRPIGYFSSPVLSKKGVVVGLKSIRLDIDVPMRANSFSDVQNSLGRIKNFAGHEMDFALNSIGLAMSTWIDAVDEVGAYTKMDPRKILPSINLEKYRNAKTREGNLLRPTDVRISENGNFFTVMVINESTLVDAFGKGQSKVDRAIRERRSFVKRAIDKKLFEDFRYVSSNFKEAIVSDRSG